MPSAKRIAQTLIKKNNVYQYFLCRFAEMFSFTHWESIFFSDSSFWSFTFVSDFSKS
jgi:hypothetical protein